MKGESRLGPRERQRCWCWCCEGYSGLKGEISISSDEEEDVEEDEDEEDDDEDDDKEDGAMNVCAPVSLVMEI